MSSGGYAASTRERRGGAAEAARARAAHAITLRRRARRRPGFLASSNHKRETPSPRHDRVPASERVFDAGGLSAVSTGRPADTHSVAGDPTRCSSSATDRAGPRSTISVGCRARDRWAAWRPAHVSNLLSRGARLRAFGRRGALASSREWNARCEPPWSERELLEKVQNARDGTAVSRLVVCWPTAMSSDSCVSSYDIMTTMWLCLLTFIAIWLY